MGLLKNEREAKEKAKSSTGEVSGKQKLLKQAILQGVAYRLNVDEDQIPTSVTILIWQFSKAEQTCERVTGCPFLYKAVHTHAEAEFEVRSRKRRRDWYYHVGCQGKTCYKRNGKRYRKE